MRVCVDHGPTGCLSSWPALLNIPDAASRTLIIVLVESRQRGRVAALAISGLPFPFHESHDWRPPPLERATMWASNAHPLKLCRKRISTVLVQYRLWQRPSANAPSPRPKGAMMRGYSPCRPRSNAASQRSIDVDASQLDRRPTCVETLSP